MPGFNPRPTLLPGDATTHTGDMAPTVLFQSTPDIATGRCAGCTRFQLRRVIGFNPRPTLLPGDAGLVYTLALDAKVSIHARHCYRAMLAARTITRNGNVFQSTPDIATGRCACCAAMSSTL